MYAKQPEGLVASRTCVGQTLNGIQGISVFAGFDLKLWA